MKNQIEDLRNHLFAQLERLGDEDLKGDNRLDQNHNHQTPWLYN